MYSDVYVLHSAFVTKCNKFMLVPSVHIPRIVFLFDRFVHKSDNMLDKSCDVLPHIFYGVIRNQLLYFEKPKI